MERDAVRNPDCKPIDHRLARRVLTMEKKGGLHFGLCEVVAASHRDLLVASLSARIERSLFGQLDSTVQ